MISQALLGRAASLQERVRRLAETEDVCEYEAAQKTLEGVRGKISAAIRAGEPVEPGPLELRYDDGAGCRWSQALMALREIPSVARAIQASPEAKRIFRALAQADTSSPYVDRRVENLRVVNATPVVVPDGVLGVPGVDPVFSLTE